MCLTPPVDVLGILWRHSHGENCPSTLVAGGFVSQVLQYNGSKCVMLASQRQSLSGLVEVGKLENVSQVECKTAFDPQRQRKVKWSH